MYRGNLEAPHLAPTATVVSGPLIRAYLLVSSSRAKTSRFPQLTTALGLSLAWCGFVLLFRCVPFAELLCQGGDVSISPGPVFYKILICAIASSLLCN